jgi:hypothetical protein
LGSAVDALPISDMNDSFTKTLVGALDRAFSAPPKNTPILIGAEVAKFDPTAALTKDERPSMKEEDRNWQAGFTETSTWTESRARVDHSLHVDKATERVKDGTLAQVRTRGYESLVSEYAARSSAGKRVMQQAGENAARLARPIMIRWVDAAERFVAAREKAESDEASRFGLTPVPSALTTETKKIIGTIKRRLANQSTGARPSDLLFFASID